VILKLVAAYVLAIASWVLLLAWAAVLLERTPQPCAGELATSPLPEPGKSGGGNS